MASGGELRNDMLYFKSNYFSAFEVKEVDIRPWIR
jgi:hypothetical protein